MNDQPPTTEQAMSKTQKRLVVLTLFHMVLFVASGFGQARINPDLPVDPHSPVKRRMLFLLPDYESVRAPSIPNCRCVAPLSARQKVEIFTGQTFDPSLVIMAAALAGIEQAGNLSPNFGQGSRAYAKRFGAMNASLAMGSFLSQTGLPMLFHQDPRYFKKETGSVASRLWYAVSRVAVTQSDRGNTTFNVSQVGSLAASTAITNSYYPAVNRTAGQNAIRFSIGLGVSAAWNIMREFGK